MARFKNSHDRAALQDRPSSPVFRCISNSTTAMIQHGVLVLPGTSRIWVPAQIGSVARGLVHLFPETAEVGGLELLQLLHKIIHTLTSVRRSDVNIVSAQQHVLHFP